MKKCLIFLLTVICLIGAATALADELRGYEQAGGYQYVTFGEYPTFADGGVAPILWRVMRIDDGAAFLLTEYIVEVRKINEDAKGYRGWEKSDLYSFLNGDFKKSAFSKAEQTALVVRTEDGALVTLVSGDDFKDESIGFGTNKSRLCESTEYAKSRGLLIYSQGHKYSPWWSRTRSTDKAGQQRFILDGGAIGRTAVNAKDRGVRPVVFVDLSRVAINGGTGTMDNPYRLIPTAIDTPDALDETDKVDDTDLTDTPEATDEQPVLELTTTPPTGDATPNSDETSTSGAPKAASENINPLFVGLAEDGFLPEGVQEFVLADKEEGLWLYASQTLRVEINRFYDVKKPLRWYEIEVFAKDGEIFRAYPFNEAKYKNPSVATTPTKMAKQHHLVFAINGDNFFYRVGRQKEVDYRYPIGLVIRGGEMLYDVPRSATSTVFPPLDVLATYADGDMKLFYNGEITAEQAMADGVIDTYAFGPILVENGEVAGRASEFGLVDNPRIALGMIEKGHYAIVMCESRTGDSTGESCVWMAERMEALGCDIALNLDGGQTASIIFMGELINKTAKYDSGNSERPQNEVIGIGVSDAVQ